LKKQIQDILNKTSDENVICEEVNNIIKTYRRIKRGRFTYDFPTDISLLELSLRLSVPDLKERSVYAKLRNDKNRGFSANNENKGITNQLIKETGKTRKELIIPFVTKS